MNNTKKSLKASNGITLIALVITIIVLLILAGISISMLSGDNSILQRATDAKTNTERATIIEQARTDILDQIVENKGKNISKAQLKSLLNTYFVENEVNSLNIPDDTSTSNDELTSKEGNYKIKLSEIYNGQFSSIEDENNSSKFYIDTTSYDFTIGQKWGEWIDQNVGKYDIFHYGTVGVWLTGGLDVCYDDYFTVVKPDEEIEGGYHYVSVMSN